MSSGIPRLSKYICELRIQFSPTDVKSSSIMNFLHKNYGSIKAAEPKLPIHVRESVNVVEPRIVARYDYGVEKEIHVGGLSESEISARLQSLVDYGKSLSSAPQ